MSNAESSFGVLVTGAAGFFGSEIVRQAIVAGLLVRATDRSAARPSSCPDYFCADILDLDSLDPAMDGVKVVIHAAGLAHIFDKKKAKKALFKEVNEVGTANVALAASEAGVKHFILISSVSVYGPFTQGVYDESAPCQPEGPYAGSKYQAELRAIEIAKASGMALTILRLATLYGENDPGNVARLMRSIDQGRFIWIGDGSNHKSLLHREDAARACLAVAQHPASGVNIYNVSAPPYSMREIVQGLASALGKPVPTWHIPGALTLAVAGMASAITGRTGRLGNLRATLQKWLADDVYLAGKFEKAFGFKTQVSLAEGLRREVVWGKNVER